jgi:hypothetical protein
MRVCVPLTNETKLRIHNITAKAALKFGSQVWVLKKREEQRLEVAQIKFLRHPLRIIKTGKEINPPGRNLECRTLFWKSNNTNESGYNT